MISLKKTSGENNEPTQPESKTPEKKGSIFGKTLSTRKTVKSKKDEYIGAKNKKKSYIRMGVSFAVLMA